MTWFPGIILYALVSRDIMLCPGFQGLYSMPWFPGRTIRIISTSCFPGILCYALVSRDYIVCPGFQGELLLSLVHPGFQGYYVMPWFPGIILYARNWKFHIGGLKPDIGY